METFLVNLKACKALKFTAATDMEKYLITIKEISLWKNL